MVSGWWSRVMMERTHTRIWVLCEAEALWATGLAIIDEAEVENFAGAAEDVDDLLFGEAYEAVSTR